ncbi:alpha/beta hydrolase [Microbacterium sp.]|uniref:alpha/beta hydrolase n=1 Tax=Microbacterium sp. TaxID=51671 RepID=UPI0039E35EED
MSLHPAFQEYLDWLNPLVEEAARNGTQATPESARAALASLNQYALPSEPVQEILDTSVRTERSTTPVRVYVPRPEEPSDIVLFVHGGGHVAGDLDVYDHQARRTAVASGMVVVSVDYRRAPEAPFPTGLEDVIDVLTHVDEATLGVATTGRVHAVADSGGGAMVASIAQRAAAGTLESPVERQVLLYPSLDYTMSGESIREFGSGYFLSAERVAWYFEQYFPAGSDRAAASPMLGPFSSRMPKTLVIAAEYDPLLSEARTYVERVRAADAAADLLVAPGMIHAFAFFEAMIPDVSDQLYRIVGDFLARGSVPTTWPETQ